MSSSSKARGTRCTGKKSGPDAEAGAQATRRAQLQRSYEDYLAKTPVAQVSLWLAQRAAIRLLSHYGTYGSPGSVKDTMALVRVLELTAHGRVPVTQRTDMFRMIQDLQALIASIPGGAQMVTDLMQEDVVELKWRYPNPEMGTPSRAQ